MITPLAIGLHSLACGLCIDCTWTMCSDLLDHEVDYATCRAVHAVGPHAPTGLAPMDRGFQWAWVPTCSLALGYSHNQPMWARARPHTRPTSALGHACSTVGPGPLRHWHAPPVGPLGLWTIPTSMLVFYHAYFLRLDSI